VPRLRAQGSFVLSAQASVNLRLDAVASQFCDHRGLGSADEAERMAETDTHSSRLEVAVAGSASTVGANRNDIHPLGITAGATLMLHWGRSVCYSRYTADL